MSQHECNLESGCIFSGGCRLGHLWCNEQSNIDNMFADPFDKAQQISALQAEVARLTGEQRSGWEKRRQAEQERDSLNRHLDAIAEALGLDKAYLPDQLAGMVRELQQQLIGANSSASDVAHQNDGDSNDEEAPTNSQREAFAWIYQWAGAMDAPASILDNLSALASGEPVPHEWQYPAMPDENAALTEQLAAARADGERLDWWTTHNDDVVYFGNDEAGGWQIDIISGKTFYADTPREAIDQARANADREKQE